MFSEALPCQNGPSTEADGRAKYTQLLLDLAVYAGELELHVPIDSTRIIPGTQGSDRPVGAKLPVVPDAHCGTDEEGMKGVLFNLRSLTGFVPPHRPSPRRPRIR